MQPSELDNLPFYDVEETIEYIIDQDKAKDKERKALNEQSSEAQTKYKPPKFRNK